MRSVKSRAASARWRACFARPARSGSLSRQALSFVAMAGIGLAACSATASFASPNPLPSAVASSPAVSQVPASAQGSFDACALLSSSDLTRILKETVGVGRAMPSGGWVAGQCTWNTASSGFAISIGTAASIQAFGDSTAPDAKARLAVFMQQASGSGETPKEVAGIGDGAVLASSGMAAYKDTRYLEVLNLGLTDKQLIQIVKLAVARL